MAQKSQPANKTGGNKEQHYDLQPLWLQLSETAQTFTQDTVHANVSAQQLGSEQDPSPHHLIHALLLRSEQSCWLRGR